TGLGITDAPPREEMFNLELTQRYLANKELQDIVPDPEKPVSDQDLRKFMEAVIEDDGASLAVRRHVAGRYCSIRGGPVPGVVPNVVPPPRAACETSIATLNPPFRRIRTYAVDPSFSTRLDTAAINEATLKIKWEYLRAGPSGEYLHVDDEDAAKVKYAPVD